MTDQNEENPLTYEVSDETLEIAAGTAKEKHELYPRRLHWPV